MKQIKEIMTTSPLSCEKDESIQSVASQMAKSNVGFLPVVDENEKVIGTITDRDVAVAIGKSSKSLEKLRVNDIMNTTVHTVGPDDNTSKALEIMRTKKVGRLPVVDKDKHLKGVVSLMRIARKVKNTDEKNELEYQGKENIINTLRSIAERNHTAENVEAFAEE